ncbi:MAG TPA: DUF1622 domain-containing protein [Nitrososphaeraceae archaeon]
MVEATVDIGKVFFDGLVTNAVYALEIIVTIIILVVVAITLFGLFKVLTLGLKKEKGKIRPHIREIVSRMLRGLLISLDFLVATDILQTILDPSATELAKLALIVAVRVTLSLSLSKEIEGNSN